MPTHLLVHARVELQALLQLCCSFVAALQLCCSNTYTPLRCTRASSCFTAALLQLYCDTHLLQRSVERSVTVSACVLLLQLCCSSVVDLLQLCCSSVAALLQRSVERCAKVSRRPLTAASKAVSKACQQLVKQLVKHVSS